MQDDFVSMRQEEQGLTVEEQSTMYIDWSIVNRSINTIVNFFRGWNYLAPPSTNVLNPWNEMVAMVPMTTVILRKGCLSAILSLKVCYDFLR